MVDDAGDVCGHGTACASIVRSLAPECELHSVRVLGAGTPGAGPVLVGGLRYAVEQGFDVVNISLSTTKREFAAALHELCDQAYFRRSILVASAHNMPVDSWPWRFSSVVSVGSHEGRDPFEFFYTTRRRRSSSSRAAWTSTSPGPAAVRCAPAATASPRRTSAGSAP